MRLSDAAAVITSFGLLVVLYTVTTHWSEITNGPRTLFGLPPATDLPLAAAVAVLALIVALAFKESRTGRLLRASRDDEVAAASLGAHIPALRWRAFVLAALLRRDRRGAVGALHHVVLAQGLLSEGDVRDPRHAGDRRPEHGDRRGRRRLHRHHRL